MTHVLYGLVLLLGSAAILPLTALAHDEMAGRGSPSGPGSGVQLQKPEPLAPRGQSLPLKPARQIALNVSSGTWLSPDISPDGETIVFEMLGDLYRMPITGGAAKPLTVGMAFDSQPVFAPHGKSIAYVSDRSGAENIWVSNTDGSSPRQVTLFDGNTVFVSPAWSADGKFIYATRYFADQDGYELWKFDAKNGKGEAALPLNSETGSQQHSLGASFSSDGRHLYFARHTGRFDHENIPEWTIVQRDLNSGEDAVLISAPRSPRPDLVLGTAFRPAISPDGKLLLYGVREHGKTGLMLYDIKSKERRWLVYPAQQDMLQGSAWRDMMPRHVFTPDSKAIIANIDGKIVRIDVVSGTRADIAFQVSESIGIGPSTRQDIEEKDGAVKIRMIQHPAASPDGNILAFSALGSLYLMPLETATTPKNITNGFMPGFSPDGRSLTFIRWSAKDSGHVWLRDLQSSAERQVSKVAAFYTDPAFTPDGNNIIALRSDNDARMLSYMEFGTTRQADLVEIAIVDGKETVLASGKMGGLPHFGPEPAKVYINFEDGVYAIDRSGKNKEKIAGVTGPNWYFLSGRANVDDLRISPNGREALVQIAQQLTLITLPDKGDVVDLSDAGLPKRRLTDVGADYFGWSADGKSLGWSIGSTWYSRSRDGILLETDAEGRTPQVAGEAYSANITLPRANIGLGTVLFRGATALPMDGNGEIRNADILVSDGRIRAIGVRGSVEIPDGTEVKDVGGKFILPGFIETHTHIADVRREVLDFESWGPLSSLAYGVTTIFDPSTLTIDMLAYQDAVDAGLMIGSRIRSTGPAIFSFNEFQSYEEVEAVLRRYRDHYRLDNIKMYRSGNRRVRQWIAQAARKIGLQPTTEGALAMKLDLTQIIDGFAGNEHALPVVPLQDDVLTLMSASGVGYTTTLMIGNGGPQGQEYFIRKTEPYDDPKLRRFAPGFIVDMKMRKTAYRPIEDYLFPSVAASAADVQRRGGLVGIGSHGEVPGLGFHWEMQAHAMGGMTAAEILLAATIGSARVIGREHDLGSLETGKIADLIILNSDPRVKIENTLSINSVMLAGVLRDGETMDEIWPNKVPLARHWFCDSVAPGMADPCK